VLTANALVGNIAARADGPLVCDADTREFTNNASANPMLKRANPRQCWYC